jgi:hypothetical protein
MAEFVKGPSDPECLIRDFKEIGIIAVEQFNGTVMALYMSNSVSKCVYELRKPNEEPKTFPSTPVPSEILECLGFYVEDEMCLNISDNTKLPLISTSDAETSKLLNAALQNPQLEDMIKAVNDAITETDMALTGVQHKNNVIESEIGIYKKQVIDEVATEESIQFLDKWYSVVDSVDNIQNSCYNILTRLNGLRFVDIVAMDNTHIESLLTDLSSAENGITLLRNINETLNMLNRVETTELDTVSIESQLARLAVLTEYDSGLKNMETILDAIRRIDIEPVSDMSMHLDKLSNIEIVEKCVTQITGQLDGLRTVDIDYCISNPNIVPSIGYLGKLLELEGMLSGLSTKAYTLATNVSDFDTLKHEIAELCEHLGINKSLGICDTCGRPF